jgi:hypothetical protein
MPEANGWQPHPIAHLNHLDTPHIVGKYQPGRQGPGSSGQLPRPLHTLPNTRKKLPPRNEAVFSAP